MKTILITIFFTIANTSLLLCQWWGDQPPIEDNGGGFLEGFGTIMLIILIIYGLVKLSNQSEEKEKKDKKNNDPNS